MGPDIVRDTIEEVEKIRKRMLAAQDRQKFYAHPKRRPLEFFVGDKIFLKVAPIKGIMRLEKKEKLSPRFIGPYEILEKVRNVAYRLALPLKLSSVHNVFHDSMLKRYISDPYRVLTQELLAFNTDLSYEHYNKNWFW